MTDVQAGCDARLALAKSKVKRSSGQLRSAAADIAAASSDAPDTLAVVNVDSARSAAQVCDLARGLRARHGVFDVVFLARPT